MAELRLTLDLRMPPDPAVVATIWAAAGIKVEPPEICRMLLLAQLAEPLDERGWQGAALIVGAALDAVAPERGAEAEAAEPEPAESVAFAQMAAAFERPLPLGGAARGPVPNEVEFSYQMPIVPLEDENAPADPKPILIEDDDVPAEGGGVPPEPKPMAEAAPEPVVEPAAAPDWLALIDRVEAGESIASVARSAGVDGRALGGKVTARRRMLKPAGPASEAAAIPAPEPISVEPEPVSVEPKDEEVDDDAPAAPEAEDAFWTPQRDLALVQAMIGGRGSYAASQQLGCKPPDCVNRFKQLLPHPGTVAQQQLLKRLRAQVEAEGVHVA